MVSWVVFTLCYWTMSYVTSADQCTEPHITNGQVRCYEGFLLVGSPIIRCRGGVWSGVIPMCTAVGSCPALPRLTNGRHIPIRGARRSAFRFGCHEGFELLGEKYSHCEGESWSGELPVCIKAACDERGMSGNINGEVLREKD